MSDGYTMLMTSMEVGSFRIVTPAQHLNLNGPLAENLAKDSAPLLRNYEVYFNNYQHFKFTP